MSPEQALGKRVTIDHRADIYSLGISLYELLTTRPAFEQESRAGLIKQIALEEPRRLRQRDHSIPRDLETIIHKAIAKSPGDRYSTAEAMSDDLRAFIENRPITARRPTWIDVSRKWILRNQGYVLAGFIFLLMASLGSLVGAVTFRQQRDEAVRQRELAETNLSQARETVDTFLTKVSEEHLFDTPSMQPLRNELLELAAEHYERFVQQRPESPALRRDLAGAFARLGEIHTTLGLLSNFNIPKLSDGISTLSLPGANRD